MIFSNHDINKFILLSRKAVYPYEYLDDWRRLFETLLPEKEDFYSHVIMEGITDADYSYGKRVCKDFEVNSFGEYHNLYFQSDTLLLVDIFENFWNTCLEIYELDPARFPFAPGLIWQAALKKTKVKLVLLTNIDTLSMIEKCITGVICHTIHRYGKANNNYMKNYDKLKDSSYLKY